MSRTSVTSAFTALAVVLAMNAAQAQQPQQQPPRQTQPRPTEQPPVQPPGSPTSHPQGAPAHKGMPSDAAAFVNQMTIANLAEVELGKMASERASNADVKAFGQMMVKDHSQANQDLAQVAAQLKVKPTTAIDQKHKDLAARLSKLQGAEVTMVEALPQPLARVLGEEMGAVCGELHRDHGVDVRTGVGVDGFEGDQRVERVRLSDGTTVDADVVVVGIGVVPNTEWLEGSGVRLDNGVVCDDTTLVAPGVVAAGDVARWPNLAFDEMMRVEHWENALEMGAHAARRLLAGDDAARIEVYRPIPWFWSDQYDRKIQMCGWPRGTDDVHVVAGSVEERRFTALYGRGGRVTAAFGMNMPARIVRYRFAIADGLDWADALAAG